MLGISLSGRQLPADLELAVLGFLSLRCIVRITPCSKHMRRLAWEAIRRLEVLLLVGREDLRVAVRHCRRLRRVEVPEDEWYGDSKEDKYGWVPVDQLADLIRRNAGTLVELIIDCLWSCARNEDSWSLGHVDRILSEMTACRRLRAFFGWLRVRLADRCLLEKLASGCPHLEELRGPTIAEPTALLSAGLPLRCIELEVASAEHVRLLTEGHPRLEDIIVSQCGESLYPDLLRRLSRLPHLRSLSLTVDLARGQAPGWARRGGETLTFPSLEYLGIGTRWTAESPVMTIRVPLICAPRLDGLYCQNAVLPTRRLTHRCPQLRKLRLHLPQADDADREEEEEEAGAGASRHSQKEDLTVEGETTGTSPERLLSVVRRPSFRGLRTLIVNVHLTQIPVGLTAYLLEALPRLSSLYIYVWQPRPPLEPPALAALDTSRRVSRAWQHRHLKTLHLHWNWNTAGLSRDSGLLHGLGRSAPPGAEAGTDEGDGVSLPALEQLHLTRLSDRWNLTRLLQDCSATLLRSVTIDKCASLYCTPSPRAADLIARGGITHSPLLAS